tara:strand:+ start:50 stop:958 length:909 start_codon:yes stop_codon:yes gene_type:complete
MSRKLLITGGTGLVGSSINEGVKINSKHADLKKWDQTKQLFLDQNPSHVIHCAARVGGLGGNMNHKGEFFYDNIMINTNVLEACRQVGVKKVISFLSTCIFPNKVEYPLTEQKIHLGEPHQSNYPYAYAKRMLDIQSRAYKEQYGVNYISVIPTNIYGPNDNFNIKNGHVLPSLIHKCYIAKQQNTPFKVWGSGKPLREFIHSKDVAKLTIWALDNYNEEEPIIFSNSKEVSIGYIAELVAKAFNYQDNIIFESDKPDGQFRKPSDNSKLKNYLPDYKFISIEDGIEDTVEWFKKNYNNIRK